LFHHCNNSYNNRNNNIIHHILLLLSLFLLHRVAVSNVGCLFVVQPVQAAWNSRFACVAAIATADAAAVHGSTGMNATATSIANFHADLAQSAEVATGKGAGGFGRQESTWNQY
jgi:hypothetical protein